MAAPDGSALHGDGWMTPSVSNAQGNEYTRDRGQEGSERLTLTGQANHWATPTMSDTTGPSKTAGQQGAPNLRTQADAWPTPSAAMMNDGESPESWQARADGLKQKHINGNGAGMPLTIAVKKWPTPTAQDSEQAGGKECIAKGNRRPTTTSAVMAWPTPASRDHKGQDLASRNGGASLSHAAQTGVFSHSLPPDQATPAGPLFSRPSPSTPQRLNPVFGEWLMGWPSQWTKAAPSASSASATALWQRKLASHLSLLLDAQGGV